MDIQKRVNKLVSKDLERCKKLKKKLELELPDLEKGSITYRDGVYKWFNRVDGKQFCRKISDDGLLFRLRKRQFVKRCIPLLESRIRNDRRYLENDVFYDPVEINAALPDKYKGMKGMGIFLDNDVNPEEWQDQDYKKGEMFEKCQQYKVDDNWVRSKSETMIIMRLQEAGFSVRYEPELVLGNKTVYPDFEILLPNCRRIVYYEHFGMIDNPEYAFKAFTKMKTYAENGIMLGFNFIITFETKDKPLTLVDIDNVIEQLRKMDE